jgi:hypothetical protein
MKRIIVAFALFVVVVLAGASARADAPAPTPVPSTAAWAVGVSDAEQTTALAIYKEGNAEFEQARYQQALVKYREAITHWDHPAIRFNIVVCLVNLDDPRTAFDNLALALKYGEAALGHDVYVQALTYQKMLLGTLAKLEITSHEPQGATVTLDGKRLFTAPGDTTELVTPGDHQIVATKPGFITQTITLTLVPGKVTVRDVKLLDLKSATKYVRRWPVWQPWAVVSAGVAVALIGLPFQLQASTNYSRYNEEFATACPNGCGGAGQPAIPPSLTSIKDSAHAQNIAAITMFSVGGATIATGLIGVFLNQPRATIPHELQISPSAGPNGASLVVGGRW